MALIHSSFIGVSKLSNGKRYKKPKSQRREHRTKSRNERANYHRAQSRRRKQCEDKTGKLTYADMKGLEKLYKKHFALKSKANSFQHNCARGNFKRYWNRLVGVRENPMDWRFVEVV